MLEDWQDNLLLTIEQNTQVDQETNDRPTWNCQLLHRELDP